MEQYTRPQSSSKLSKVDRTHLLKDLREHYADLYQTNPNMLNQKLPRDAFTSLLNRIGVLLMQETQRLAAEPGPVRDFIKRNTLPPALDNLLPIEYRAFCLGLNALKTWVSAEQGATDRFIVRGRARMELRAVADTCIVTGQSLAEVGIDLHHPVRDGRPPIPLSPEGHKIVERQHASKRLAVKAPNGSSAQPPCNAALDIIYGLRAKSGRSFSNLRKGCLDLMGESVLHGTPNVGASSKTFARKVREATKLSCPEIIALLDEHGL